MQRAKPRELVVASLDLAGCPQEPVLAPLEPPGDAERDYFAGWETPLAPWGGFRLPSGLEVVGDEGQTVLAFLDDASGRPLERALVVSRSQMRDCGIAARIKPLAADAAPHNDRADCSEALVGVVFRVMTSRWYYQFGIEGRQRAVLYRRQDDEWFALAEQDVDLPDGYLTLEVTLDGDAMQCRCKDLGVEFSCTDTTFRTGRAGVRSLGRAHVASLAVTQTPSQQAEDERRRAAARAARQSRGSGVPDAVEVRTFDLAELGGDPSFADFAVPDRYDLLVSTPDSLRAVACEGGALLWEFPEPVWHVVCSRNHGDGGRLLYGLVGRRSAADGTSVTGREGVAVINEEIVVIRGADGEELARRTIPELPPTARQADFSPTTLAFSDSAATDIVLREWDHAKGGGGVSVWAYDRELTPLWHHEQAGAWYGHHWALAVHDVDSDGRDELLAGGVLYDAEGNVLWTHDRSDEVLEIPGAHHYDAVALGDFADDEELDPVAFLLAGSAGVYVVDGLTGETRAIHRVGHAQGRYVGKVRADLPGQQVLVATRWGNMGILTLFSGRGERLWTIQPDCIGQGSCPVSWPGAEAQLIWMNTTGPVQALHDGHGRLVKELQALRNLYGDRMRRDVEASVIRMGSDPTDYLALTCDGRMHVFGPPV